MINRINALATSEIQERNFVQSFLPFRNKGHEFDFAAIAGAVGASLIKKRVPKGYDLENFEKDSVARLERKLSDPNFSQTIREMYFQGDGLLQTSPLFFLFKDLRSSEAGNKHMSLRFKNMLEPYLRSGDPVELSAGENFLEGELLAELNGRLENSEFEATEASYLPFLAEYLSKDLIFLASIPKFFLANIEKCLKLYGFLYSSQLALNLNGWTEHPRSKPLFFILDTEKASKERSNVKKAHNELKDAAGQLFPVLSILEYFNDSDAINLPLWQYYDAYEAASSLQQQQCDQALKTFLKNYREKRQLPEVDSTSLTGRELFRTIISSAMSVFDKSREGPFTVNNRYVDTFIKNIASHFIQRRGRSGYVLILNQDNLLLLTNLAIGNRDRIPFRDLLAEFKNRGVWFDRQSETALIQFFERVGNIERMSDSGDAVYVRKTI